MTGSVGGERKDIEGEPVPDVADTALYDDDLVEQGAVPALRPCRS